MKKAAIMKKLMSTMLLFALVMCLFGGITSGPDAQAVSYSDFGTISLKVCNFATSGYDFDEVSKTALYPDGPVSLFFKRKSGCRIPKGSYIRVLRKNDFLSLKEDGIYPPSQMDFVKYKSGKTKLNYNEFSVTWPGGWKAGKYVVCLVMPYTTYDNKAYVLYYNWNVTVKNYG